MTDIEERGTLSEEEQRLVPRGQPQTDTLLALVNRALVDPALDVTKLEKLLELKERYDREEARKAFVAAMAQFRRKAPVLSKDSHVYFKTDRGVTEYDHATLGGITGKLGPALGECGLSWEWETRQGDGGRITVTCILTHIGGHFTRTELSGSPDQSGGKNAIQAVGSTVSYLQRYTLLAATGMATMDQDDDGRTSEATVGAEGVDEERDADHKAALLRNMAEATSMPALTGWFNKLSKASQALVEPEFKAKRKELMTKRPG